MTQRDERKVDILASADEVVGAKEDDSKRNVAFFQYILSPGEGDLQYERKRKSELIGEQ
jgi:hypothetical protein